MLSTYYKIDSGFLVLCIMPRERKTEDRIHDYQVAELSVLSQFSVLFVHCVCGQYVVGKTKKKHAISVEKEPK